jgi:hypothetical protein
MDSQTRHVIAEPRSIFASVAHPGMLVALRANKATGVSLMPLDRDFGSRR